jgi:excisionase family DNA binding protein
MSHTLLSIHYFCEEYTVSRSLTYRLIALGQLKAVKIGKLTRIRLEDAEAWAANLHSSKPAA